MITSAKEFLTECRKDKAFKNAVDAIDNKYIIDFAEAYAELRLSNFVWQSEQLPKKVRNCECVGMRDKVVCNFRCYDH